MSDAGFTITVDDPSYPPGTPIGIHGLGEFENGSTTDISPEQAEAFSLANSTQTAEYDEDGELVVTTTPGPTLDEVELPNVTVGGSSGRKKKSDDDDDDDAATGTIAEVLERVGDDPDKAQEALDAEESKAKPRAGLVEKLQDIIEGSDE